MPLSSSGRRWVVAGLALALLTLLIARQFSLPTAERVVYHDYELTGEEPLDIPLEITAPPTADLSDVVETPMPDSFAPNELIRLYGSLEALEPYPLALSVNFIVVSPGRPPRIAGGHGCVPRGRPEDFELLLNVPKDPGRYEMRVSWGGGALTDFIAKATIIVKAP